MNAKLFPHHVGNLSEGLVITTFNFLDYLGFNILEFGFASPATLNFKNAISITGSYLVFKFADAALTHTSKPGDASAAATSYYQHHTNNASCNESSYFLPYHHTNSKTAFLQNGFEAYRSMYK